MAPASAIPLSVGHAVKPATGLGVKSKFVTHFSAGRRLLGVFCLFTERIAVIGIFAGLLADLQGTTVCIASAPFVASASWSVASCTASRARGIGPEEP